MRPGLEHFVKTCLSFEYEVENIDLISRVVQRATVLDNKLSQRFLLVKIHLGPDHELGVSLRQVSLLHQPLELEILLTGDHDYLVHVGDHDAGLEE